MKLKSYIHLYSFVISVLIFSTKCQCTAEKGKNPLPYFRRQPGDFMNRNTNTSNPYDSQLVSFLVNNVEEIFRDTDDVTEEFIKFSPTDDSEANIAKRTTIVKKYSQATHSLDTDLDYGTMTVPVNMSLFGPVLPVYEIKHANKKTHSLLLSGDNMRKSEQKLVNNHTIPKISALVSENTRTTLMDFVEPGHERSCIFCDNVKYEDCSDPRNKLIPSVICKREGDQCYSLHTPFGIIDRGCFNVNNNLTIYVCSCNLCNYFSISDLPYIFTNRREWVHNVVELSRARNLRKSVAKDMSCLKCEVNNTARSQGNIIYNSNCLNGNIGNLPTEVCDSNEVCGIKVIKSDGYIWRGCVKTPLYNYYWSLCNEDLCNYDTLISIYDYI